MGWDGLLDMPLSEPCSQDSGHVWPFLVHRLMFEGSSPNHEAALRQGHLGRGYITRLLAESKEQQHPKLGRGFHEMRYSLPLAAQQTAATGRT